MSPEEIEFFRAVAELIEPVVVPTIEYRLHYSIDGNITACSMANHPESDLYLVVDKDTYDHYYQYQIVDNRLKKIDYDARYCVQLSKASTGYAVVQNHAGLIIEPNETYPVTEYYARCN